jgi:hypothetical protein
MSFLMHEESATGIITKKNNAILYINITTDQCATGTKKCESGCGACSGMEQGKTATIYAPEAVNYRIGDVISFKYHVINDAFMTIFAFGVPIGCALLVLALWFLKAPEKIESGLALLSAGLAFAFGLFLVWLTDMLLRKRFPAKILPPKS